MFRVGGKGGPQPSTCGAKRGRTGVEGLAGGPRARRERSTGKGTAISCFRLSEAGILGRGALSLHSAPQGLAAKAGRTPGICGTERGGEGVDRRGEGEPNSE